jgi:hypothetical protein
MSFVIAIPTHRRATTIHKKTLKLLSVFPRSIIHIFIEPSEVADYDLSGYTICPGRPGTIGQRQAIEDYFPEGQRVLCLDDDISAIKTLIPMELPDLFERCFDIAAREGCLLWGVAPTDNGLSMRDSATVGLSFIIGSCFGFTVKHKIEYDSNLTEDFERTVQHYHRFKSHVIRFNGIGPRTKFAAAGGLEEFRRGTAQEDAARAFAAKYPGFCRLRIREGKQADVVIKTIAHQRLLHPFSTPTEKDFALILDELRRRPIALNRYRNIAGDGRSQAFGVVGRRCLNPDYSRQCWLRPYLYKLLLDYGKKFVKIPWTSITVNDNYSAAPHRDRGNVGQSYLVGFGNYSGGELQMHEGDLSGAHDIRHRPIITDFSAVLHSVKQWEGQRYSLVFYTAKDAEDLPPADVQSVGGKWVFFRGGVPCSGLPHPLKGRKVSATTT